MYKEPVIHILIAFSIICALVVWFINKVHIYMYIFLSWRHISVHAPYCRFCKDGLMVVNWPKKVVIKIIYICCDWLKTETILLSLSLNIHFNMEGCLLHWKRLFRSLAVRFDTVTAARCCWKRKMCVQSRCLLTWQVFRFLPPSVSKLVSICTLCQV